MLTLSTTMVSKHCQQLPECVLWQHYILSTNCIIICIVLTQSALYFKGAWFCRFPVQSKKCRVVAVVRKAIMKWYHPFWMQLVFQIKTKFASSSCMLFAMRLKAENRSVLLYHCGSATPNVWRIPFADSDSSKSLANNGVNTSNNSCGTHDCRKERLSWLQFVKSWFEWIVVKSWVLSLVCAAPCLSLEERWN